MAHPTWVWLARHPHPLALPFAERLEVGGVAGHAVVVNVLLIGGAADPGVATDAVGAERALLDEGDLDLLPLQLRLAEAAAKQVRRDAAILLADLDVQAFGLTVDHAGLTPGQPGQ